MGEIATSSSEYQSFIIPLQDMTQYNSRLAIAENKIEIMEYTATSVISHILHNLSYDSSHDELFCFYDGTLMKETENYTVNANGMSIDLIGWSLSVGEMISFVLYKYVK